MRVRKYLMSFLIGFPLLHQHFSLYCLNLVLLTFFSLLFRAIHLGSHSSVKCASFELKSKAAKANTKRYVADRENEQDILIEIK